MTDSHSGATTTRKNILDYLKTLGPTSADLDVAVKTAGRNGLLHIRQGKVVAAECGRLQGNGALLTLAALGGGDVRETRVEQAVATTVSVTVPQIEGFFAKMPGLSKVDEQADEERVLHDALRLLFQFRRKEAGAKLVEVLRSNRFYYPAWLWHSRLMTREDLIKKALNEARRWGNADLSIKREVQKIEPQFTGASEPVRRCIFCWSLLGSGEERCGHCRGLQRLSAAVGGQEAATGEVRETLTIYEQALQQDSRNSRIAYCLGLGYCSLGQLDRARQFIGRALTLAPREPLFVRAAAVLGPAPGGARLQPASRPADKRVQADKTILVVEDSKTARKVISLVLGRKGYHIIEASSGTEALLAIEGISPDLVLLDVMLPDMTGYEVLSAIRAKSGLSAVPVVMLTGKSGAADRSRGMASGSNEYLTKPFDPAKLLTVLGKYLDLPPITGAASQAAQDRKVQAPPPRPETAVRPAAAQPAAAAKTAGAAVARKDLKAPARSVLVVEDSPTSRKVISMVLTRKGYAVNEAVTGGEALRRVEEQLPHLILLDAMLPDMTGYEILGQLKQDQRLKDIPVVMLTAKDSPVDRQKGMKAGAAVYLTKPFDPEKLLAVIGDFI